MINRLLIANRGEIACRIIRTARDMGLHTIALHTDLDRSAPHVRAADESVAIGSYLDIDAVLAAAKASSADAIHPGYGFLSERSAFARAIEEAGLTLVGPSSTVMDQMGRKDAAREIAVQAGVPVVPAYDVEGAADSFDYPVLVKAAAGGGGKGMRVVREAGEYAEAVAAARREAQSSFGDDTMLVEKYVESGRHIEVQVIGDAHGHVLHLFERDCSTQRRHQKVLEEAPAPTLTDEQRDEVTSAAVALAEQVGYVNAGTVEFLLDNATGRTYFLEMNTRLQVEHPVTELVVSVDGAPLDLVELQLLVASGEPLPVTQDQVSLSGHAIEARVYAEDSFGGFLPQAGTATHVQWPTGVRVDEALESGQVVSTSYDPMLGKVIAFGRDREEARRRLVQALGETTILGLTTNTGFLRALAATEEFRDATVDTAWLDQVSYEEGSLARPSSEVPRALAAWAAAPRPDGATPFRSDGWRMCGEHAPVRVDLDPVVVVRADRIDQTRAVELAHRTDGSVFDLTLALDGVAERGRGRVGRHRIEVVHQGQRFVFERPDVFASHGAAAGEGSLTAPMPGTVLAVDVAEGETVEQGQRLGVLEAMKMELALKAPFDGTVTTVGAAVGGQVALGQVLFVVEEEANDG